MVNDTDFQNTGTITEIAKSMVILTDQKKTLKKELDFVQDQLNEKQSALLEAMTNEQVDKISVLGKCLFPKVATYASIPQKDAGFKWLRDNGYGELVQETVNARTLAATAKGLIDKGEALPSEIFNVNERTTIGIRKG